MSVQIGNRTIEVAQIADDKVTMLVVERYGDASRIVMTTEQRDALVAELTNPPAPYAED